MYGCDDIALKIHVTDEWSSLSSVINVNLTSFQINTSSL